MELLLKEESNKLNIEFHNYLNKNTKKLSKPKAKFIKDFLKGMLSAKHIYLNAISRNLNEKISPKKTSERLSYHLEKSELKKEVSNNYLDSVKNKLKDFKYLIYDGSDITKSHATCMEGIKKVRDGSKSSKNKHISSNGYHWDNYIAVNDTGILPLYSDIFSTDLDEESKISENNKIINSVMKIRDEAKYLDSILVIDRGGDRRVLINDFLHMEQKFIVRQKGNRHLFYNDKSLPLKDVYKETKLNYSFEFTKVNKNRKYKKKFKAGAVQVFMPETNLKEKINTPLWLVTSQEKGKGFSWFLAFLDTNDPEEATKITMDGYSKRWKIEEFHRQVKQDFKLEKIAFQKYSVIKNIGSLLVLIMGFIASINKDLASSIMILTKQYYKNRKSDLPRYIYYRLTEAVSIIIKKWKKITKKRKIKDKQLYLKLKIEY